jgi:hypothetical protein
MGPSYRHVVPDMRFPFVRFCPVAGVTLFLSSADSVVRIAASPTLVAWPAFDAFTAFAAWTSRWLGITIHDREHEFFAITASRQLA